MIIGLTGKAGSGKGTVADYLVSKYHAVKLRFSAVLDDILRRLFLDVSRENEINLAMALREKFGPDVLARALLFDLKEKKLKLGVLDGIRYREEYEVFKQEPDFFLVYLDTPFELRYQRNLKRGEKKDDKVSFERFKEMELSPTEIYIEKFKTEADYIIDNSGSLDVLYQKIDHVLGPKIIKG